MSVPMLCSRPQAHSVNFETERFIVSKVSGLTVSGRQLEMGEEVPSGALSPDVLRSIYERPLCLIETVGHAFSDPDLRQACEARGVSPEATPLNLDALDATALRALCVERGLPSDGNASKLRKRLTAVVG